MQLKHYIFVIVIFIISVITNNLQAQTIPGLDVLTDELSSEGTQKIEDAQKSLEKAATIMKKVEQEDKALQPIFKKKKKKGEKKAVEAKFLRIEATQAYHKAYQQVYEAYKSVVEPLEFNINSDDIIAEADASLTEADKVLKQYKGIKKNKLKKKSYDQLKRDLIGSVDKYTTAMNEMVKLYGIWQKEQEKNQAAKADESAWSYATDLNTKESYEEYLYDYPTGKYMKEARSRIAQFEEAERQERLLEEERRRAMEKSTPDLVYYVQIRAAKKKIPLHELKRLYKNDDITEIFYKGWYKYLVGKQTKYDEAIKLRDSLKIRRAFVIALEKGTPIDIKKAIKLEKGEI